MKRSESEFLKAKEGLFNRREALIFFGSLSAATLIGGYGAASATGSSAGNSNCVVTPLLTDGPFFVDERLNRSDVTDAQPGLPLQVNIYVYKASTSGCPALSGAQVDIWHTNALGVYSDVSGSGNDQTFLRGYQVTDEAGNVTFRTIYPGWYRGRTPHIHVKVRMFNPSGNETLEASTQLFFDDAISDSVYANPPYNSRPNRGIRNSQDGIYGERSSLLLPLNGSAASGYTGAFRIGVAG